MSSRFTDKSGKIAAKAKEKTEGKLPAPKKELQNAKSSQQPQRQQAKKEKILSPLQQKQLEAKARMMAQKQEKAARKHAAKLEAKQQHIDDGHVKATSSWEAQRANVTGGRDFASGKRNFSAKPTRRSPRGR